MSELRNPLRVLVPLDGSELSETILPSLMPLVARRPVRLTLLRVISRVDDLEAEKAYLARIERRLRDDGVKAASRLEFGRPTEEILHLANPEQADLVAMTTHGRTGLLRIIMGSVAAKVLRHAEVPLVFHTPGARMTDWLRIVVALDGTPMAEAVLEDVTTLAKLMQSTIHVVRVTLPLLPTGDPYFERMAIDTEGPERYVDQICDRLLKQGMLAVPEIREGFAAQEIVKSALEHRAGLIAMSTLGRVGRARPMERSVAGDVLSLAPCQVLLRRTILPPSTGSKGEGKRIPMLRQEA